MNVCFYKTFIVRSPRRATFHGGPRPRGASIFYNNRGGAWQKKGEHDRAIADYSEAIGLDPSNPCPFYNRGIAWSSKGDYDRAIADYSEAERARTRGPQPKSVRPLWKTVAPLSSRKMAASFLKRTVGARP